jgi:hypothetical protein
MHLSTMCQMKRSSCPSAARTVDCKPAFGRCRRDRRPWGDRAGSGALFADGVVVRGPIAGQAYQRRLPPLPQRTALWPACHRRATPHRRSVVMMCVCLLAVRLAGRRNGNGWLLFSRAPARRAAGASWWEAQQRHRTSPGSCADALHALVRRRAHGCGIGLVVALSPSLRRPTDRLTPRQEAGDGRA